MLKLLVDGARRAPLRVLCLGAHCDDIEIGCGGAILTLTNRCAATEIHWVVFAAHGTRRVEAQKAASLFTAGGTLKGADFKGFRDSFLPYHGGEVKAVFEDLKEKVNPDLIFTQYGHDAHQDHRLLAELTWNTWRDHLILEYEIPKYDGDLGRPNVFLPLENEICERKVDYIVDTFKTQCERRWFQREVFLSIMRIRGMECNAPSGYAEAFYCRKLVI